MSCGSQPVDLRSCEISLIQPKRVISSRVTSTRPDAKAEWALEARSVCLQPLCEVDQLHKARDLQASRFCAVLFLHEGRSGVTIRSMLRSLPAESAFAAQSLTTASDWLQTFRMLDCKVRLQNRKRSATSSSRRVVAILGKARRQFALELGNLPAPKTTKTPSAPILTAEALKQLDGYGYGRGCARTSIKCGSA